MDGNDVARSYDCVAEIYAERFFGELDHKPLDRALLDFFASQLVDRGRVGDLGCGPGHLARYLRERGVDAIGIDLSPAMIEVARRLSPGVAFEIGSMLKLAASDKSFAGVAAFYAIVNLTHEEVRCAFAEMHRILMPGAPFLLSFHLGDERLHLDEFLGGSVALDFYFFSRSFIEEGLLMAGFEIDAWIERRPYPSEHPSTRAYVVARRPSHVPEGLQQRQLGARSRAST